LPGAGVQVEDACSLGPGAGSVMKIQQRYCQGLSASWYSQQRTVQEDTASTTPRCTAPRASPGTRPLRQRHPVSAGSRHASVLTCTACSAVNDGGRPVRLRSASPGMPSSANRHRHGRAVSRCRPVSRAIHALERPLAEGARCARGSGAGRGSCGHRPSSSTVTPGGGQPYQADGSNEQGRQANQQKWTYRLDPAVGRDAATRQDGPMPTVPESTKTSSAQKLAAQARTACPPDVRAAQPA
jgi:hypothetical protein